MNPIKYDDPILGKIDELLGGGIFRSERRSIGTEVETAIRAGDAKAVQKILTELGDLKSVNPESIVKTPVLCLAAFGVMAQDKINARLARSVAVPVNDPPMSLSYSTILLIASKYRGAAESATTVVNGRLALSKYASEELIDFVCNAVESRKLTAIEGCAKDGLSGLEQMLTEWREGETMMERILRHRREDEERATAAAERRRQRQLAAGFNDEDIVAGLADDIK